MISLAAVGSFFGKNWKLFLIIAIASSGYIWGFTQKAKVASLQQELIQSDLEKFIPVRDSISSGEAEKIITLEDIQTRKAELEQLETEFEKKDTTQLSLEDALKIIGG